MIHYYRYQPSNLEKDNEWFFSENTFKFAGTPLFDKILSEFEDAVRIPGLDGMYSSKFEGEVIRVSELSTGCKTILNAVFNKDKVFALKECGQNAITYMYNLDSDVHVYHEYLITSVNRLPDIVCYTRDEIIGPMPLRDMAKEMSRRGLL